MAIYEPKTENVIQKILTDHYSNFEDIYDKQYSKDFGGEYRLFRIHETARKFMECGDYSKGIAKIKCTNPQCNFQFFRPPFPVSSGIFARHAIKNECYCYQNIYAMMFY